MSESLKVSTRMNNTCDFFIDPDKPETWPSQELNRPRFGCYVNEENLDEDGVWRCPHESKSDGNLCMLHLHHEKKDGEEFVKYLEKVLNSSDKKLNQLIGADIPECEISDIEISTNSPIFLSHSVVNGEVEFKNIDIPTDMIFKGSYVKSNISFTKINTNDINFDYSVIEGDIEFYSDRVVHEDYSNTVGTINFNYSIINGILNIESTTANEDINVSQCIIEGDDRFWVNKLSLSHVHTENDLRFNGIAVYGNMALHEVSCDKADFHNIEIRGDFTFSNSQAKISDFSASNLAGGKNFHSIEISDTIVFRHVDLSDAKITDIDIFHGDFEDSKLTNADLRGSDISYANLEGAEFDGAKLSGTNLSGAKMYSTTFDGATVTQRTVFDQYDEYRCVYDPYSDYDYDNWSKLKQVTKSMNTYHTLERLTRQNSLPESQSKFFARRQDMRREQLRIQESFPRLSYWFAELQNSVFRHGESFSRVVGWGFITILFFSFVYPLGGWVKKETPTGEVAQVYTYDEVIESPILFWESFYHSGKLFLTGSGTLTPSGTVGEILMLVESLIAPILLALIVFVLGRRAAR